MSIVCLFFVRCFFFRTSLLAEMCIPYGVCLCVFVTPFGHLRVISVGGVNKCVKKLKFMKLFELDVFKSRFYIEREKVIPCDLSQILRCSMEKSLVCVFFLCLRVIWVVKYNLLLKFFTGNTRSLFADLCSFNFFFNFCVDFSSHFVCFLQSPIPLNKRCSRRLLFTRYFRLLKFDNLTVTSRHIMSVSRWYVRDLFLASMCDFFSHHLFLFTYCDSQCTSARITFTKEF